METSRHSQGPRRSVPVAMLLATLALGAVLPSAALERREYKVYIVVDVLKPKFQDVIDGFRQTLDRELAAAGARASYTILDTKTDPATVPGILEALREAKPDLVCAVNNPAAFADTNISLKLDPQAFRVVSENCIPVESGVAKTWERPGGHITGVGVFVQMESIVRLARMVRPEARKLAFYSWNAMAKINEWFLPELRRASAATGVELAEVRHVASLEEELEFLAELDRRGTEWFTVPGVSSWVHRDGSYADATTIGGEFVRTKLRRLPIYVYDESSVAAGALAGACVIWSDLGAQLGDKAMKMLQGARPGDLAWEYPRKQNLVLNLAMAKNLGITFPDNLVRAAYRVYTDFQGNFVGGKN